MAGQPSEASDWIPSRDAAETRAWRTTRIVMMLSVAWVGPAIAHVYEVWFTTFEEELDGAHALAMALHLVGALGVGALVANTSAVRGAGGLRFLLGLGGGLCTYPLVAIGSSGVGHWLARQLGLGAEASTLESLAHLDITGLVAWGLAILLGLPVLVVMGVILSFVLMTTRGATKHLSLDVDASVFRGACLTFAMAFVVAAGATAIADDNRYLTLQLLVDPFLPAPAPRFFVSIARSALVWSPFVAAIVAGVASVVSRRRWDARRRVLIAGSDPVYAVDTGPSPVGAVPPLHARDRGTEGRLVRRRDATYRDDTAAVAYVR